MRKVQRTRRNCSWRNLKRGIISISRSRDAREDDALKSAGATCEIPMQPWVVELLKRLPRRLHADGSEFLFLTPEGKPMTDTWWPIYRVTVPEGQC
jgi:hypothetical protein